MNCMVKGSCFIREFMGLFLSVVFGFANVGDDSFF